MWRAADTQKPLGHPLHGLPATHISRSGRPSREQRPARSWPESAPARTEHPPRTILAVPEGDHLNHLVHRSRHLSELSLQLAKRVPPASFSTTPIKEHLEHPQRHRSGASRGARTAPRCRRRGRSPPRSTEARPCGRCGGGRAPSAAQSPCPGFAASVPAQRLEALREIGTIVCAPLGGRQWWVQCEESSHGAVALTNRLLCACGPERVFPSIVHTPTPSGRQVAQCAGSGAGRPCDELCRKRRLNSD